MGWETGYLEEARKAIVGAATEQELEEARVAYLGRRSKLTEALRSAKDFSVEERAELNRTKAAIEELVQTARQELRAKLDRSLAEEQVDVTLPGEEIPRGRLHLITQIRREVEDIFLGMGYEVIDGREVETAHYLFDALNMPPGHPTRSPLHTFFLNGDVVLRTETSPSQVHSMEAKPPPVYMVSLGRCYRRDTPDATHFPIFNQVEGLAVDEGITLADLKGTLLHLLRQLFGDRVNARFATHFFPFTEPSMEAYVSCFLCEGAGCRVCKHSGWIEIGGSGVVDPNVLSFVGYDPEQVSGYAFGWGLERIAMFRHGIPDLRALWQNDLRLIEQF